MFRISLVNLAAKYNTGGTAGLQLLQPINISNYLVTLVTVIQNYGCIRIMRFLILVKMAASTGSTLLVQQAEGRP
jgi:hypothetical protein